MEQRHSHRRVHSRTQQLDLFGPEATDPVPAWEEMPERTRQDLTGLVTQLLLEVVRPTARGDHADDA